MEDDVSVFIKIAFYLIIGCSILGIVMTIFIIFDIPGYIKIGLLLLIMYICEKKYNKYKLTKINKTSPKIN